MIRKYLMGLVALCASMCAFAQTESADSVAVVDSVPAVMIDLNPTDLFEQYNLGRDYLEGDQAVERDDVKGLYWIEQSAAQGLADAQLLAGICRYSGIGCEPDESEALRWLNLAASQDQPYSFFMLGSICANRDPADWKNAVNWFSKGAELGQPNCQTELAICYINELGVDLNYAKAAELLQKAIDADIPDAYFFLGMLYRHGAGVSKDEIKGNLLIEKAAAMGQEDAKRLLK